MEAEFVRWLTARIPPRDDVQLGIGDDAAVIAGGPMSRVVATDLLCDGVHFIVGKTEPRLIGRKALAVNLSDLAAMGAVPDAALVSLLWPQALNWRLACDVIEGLLELADEFEVQLIGGDTNRWTGDLVINVTVLGHATERGVLTRSAAQVGDAILLTGPVGGSLLGHHLSFRPLVNECLRWHAQFDLHAAMDVSDGLLLDLHRLTEASHVGAELQLAQIPVTAAAHQLSQTSGRSPLDHALSDGEDFELLLTASPATADQLLQDAGTATPLARIGTIVDQPGLWTRDEHGQRHALSAQGYLH